MKIKASKDFETMRNDLTNRSKQELETLSLDYEAMLEDIRRKSDGENATCKL